MVLSSVQTDKIAAGTNALSELGCVLRCFDCSIWKLASYSESAMGMWANAGHLKS